MQPKIYTSKTNPLRIDEIPGYNIGLTMCPGKSSFRGEGGWWARNIDDDIEAIRKQRYSAVLSLLAGEPEYIKLGLEKEYIEAEYKRLGIKNLHFKMWNDQIPKFGEFYPAWRYVRPALYRQLADNKKLLIHCDGGIGRSGMIAAIILIDLGMDNKEAIDLVSETRPGSFYHDAQRHFIGEYKKQ